MNKWIKRGLNVLLAASIIYGTYTARDGDFPPLYSHKTGDSYGINLSLVTVIDSGASVNGANISLITNNYGTINGTDISIACSNKGTLNGLGAHILSLGGSNNGVVNGLDIGGIASTYKQVNGGQISLFGNAAQQLNGFQLGIYNSAESDGVLLNVNIGAE